MENHTVNIEKIRAFGQELQKPKRETPLKTQEGKKNEVKMEKIIEERPKLTDKNDINFKKV